MRNRDYWRQYGWRLTRACIIFYVVILFKIVFEILLCQQDDFDFNEVFAEYFSHEFDLDPLNAYTSSMANYNTAPTATVQGLPTAAQAHAAALAQTSNAVVEPTTLAADATTTVDATAAGGSSVVPNPTTTTAPTTTSKGFHLPTGGIKTAFHVGSSVPSRPAGVIVPPTKRTKSETATSSANTMPPPTTVPSATTAPTPIAALALAHQQAASAAAVQQLQEQQQQQLLNQQQTQQQLAVLQQFGMQAQQLQQQQQQQLNLATAVPTTVTSSTTATTAAAAGVGPATAAANKAAAATANRVALPVGVGIRLGGLGGIAPATAAATARPPMIQAQFAAALWGGAAAAAAGGGAPALLPGANEQAAAERRQRNREHAKRSRVRKKFMLESMQEQVRSLQIENQNLRMIVQEHIPEHAVSIISECCTTSPLFAEPEEEKAGTAGDAIPLGKSDFSLMESLTSGQRCFVLSDPKLPDNPIVFASPGFYEMTGYTAKEVLGRNCRFLQGPGTDPRAVDVIRKAIATGADATICLLNYKADGTPFWNQFFIAALRDSDNCIVNYVSVKERTTRICCVSFSVPDSLCLSW